MTKQDYMDAIKEDMDELLDRQDDPFFRGQYIALDYARDLARHIRPYGTRKTAKTMEIRLTPEQERHLESLLGDGELDRLLRIKLTRARNEYLASND